MRTLWLLGLLVGGVGCAGAMTRSDDLLMDVRTFQEGLRWRKYDMAAAHIPPAARDEFLERHDELDKDLRIDDYELERVKVEDDTATALVRVKYTWHLDSKGSVHDTVVEERWERQGKVWRVVGSAHKRGEELPQGEVVAETATEVVPRPAPLP
jgi:hypothetical protein